MTFLLLEKNDWLAIFVFAVWLSKIEFSEKFIKDFNNALSYGLKNINLALKKRENNFLECSNPINI